MKKIIPQYIRNIYHLFQAILANVWFGFPSRKLKVIGVTGTNGKTTTVQMIAKILEEAGFKIAVASTINFKIGEKEWVNDTKFTTFSSFRLQNFLRQAARAGCDYAVIEVTSHALDQYRVWGIVFSVAVITNITREHLDYHGTMDKYAEAKKKLFRIVSKNPEGMSVVNLGMEFVEDFLKYPAKEKYGFCIGYRVLSIEYRDVEIVEAKDIQSNIHNTQYTILNTHFTLNLPGQFNIENALAATCAGISQGISLEKISQALAKIKGIPGRMERIENNRGLEIIVDYAVTPDSLEKLYDHIAKLKKEGSRAVAVFGACGERDRGKRPIMGRVVARIADFVVVTNEDPYNEDPARIINEVFGGVIGHKVEGQIPNFKFQISNFKSNPNDKVSKCKTEGVNAFRILDRREAIKKALQIAKPGDIVVVTGKGAEETMAIGNERIPWNDPRVIREVLREQASGRNR